MAAFVYHINVNKYLPLSLWIGLGIEIPRRAAPIFSEESLHSTLRASSSKQNIVIIFDH